MQGLWIRYVTDKGAHVSRKLRPEQVEKVLRTLRRPADLMLNREVVGGIVENDGQFDGARGRWVWWYDPDVLAA